MKFRLFTFDQRTRSRLDIQELADYDKAILMAHRRAADRDPDFKPVQHAYPDGTVMFYNPTSFVEVVETCLAG